jgi:hypothetical protein
VDCVEYEQGGNTADEDIELRLAQGIAQFPKASRVHLKTLVDAPQSRQNCLPKSLVAGPVMEREQGTLNRLRVDNSVRRIHTLGHVHGSWCDPSFSNTWANVAPSSSSSSAQRRSSSSVTRSQAEA